MLHNVPQGTTVAAVNLKCLRLIAHPCVEPRFTALDVLLVDCVIEATVPFPEAQKQLLSTHIRTSDFCENRSPI